MGRIGKAGSRGLRATLMALALLPALAQPQNASPKTLVPETPAASPPAASTTAGSRLAADQVIPLAELEAFVDGVVQDAMAADHIAGVSVAVVQGGRPALLKGYGYSHLNPTRPVDPHRTLFRLASMSKTFTWVLLMKEVERGRVKLDAPVNDYLPAELKIADQGFSQPIRIADLLSHTTGFDSVDLASHPAADRGENIVAPLDYLVRFQPQRVREPGSVATYSNYAVALAGYIVARVNAIEYQTLVEREIFAPLHLDRTTFREPYMARSDLPAPMSDDLARDLSAGFFWTGAGFKPTGSGYLTEYLTAIGPAGSASTTAADMARYLIMQLNDGSLEGATIYGPGTAEALRTPLLQVPAGVNGWAHGFMRMELPGGYHGYGHGGSGEAFKGYFNVVHELDLGIFLGANTPTGWSLAVRLPELIVGHFYAPAPTPQQLHAPGDVDLLKEAYRYEGYYAPTRRAHSGLLQFLDSLTNLVTVDVTAEGYLLTKAGAPPFSSSGRAWVPDGALGEFRAAQGVGRLTFELGPDGRAIAYPNSMGTETLERVTLAHDPELLNLVLALAAMAVLGAGLGAIARIGKQVPQTFAQVWSARLPPVIGTLWLIAIVAWFVGLSDEQLLYRWPGSALPLANIAALLAAFGSLALVVLLPLIWRPAALGDWTVWRKTRHTTAVAMLLALAALVTVRGGLCFP